MLRTLGKTTWEKIKINEVFACQAKYLGWIINIKINKTECMDLEYDFPASYMCEHEGDIIEWKDYADKLYKLPKSVQRLFKEE